MAVHIPATQGMFCRATYGVLDTAEALYALLGAAQDGAAPATDQQAFFDLLQRAGEEAGLLDLEDETLDECVPLAVVEEAVASHAEAFAEDLAGVLQ